MANDTASPSPAAPQPRDKPSAFIRWSARVLCWLCWAVIAVETYVGALALFDAIPKDWVNDGVVGQATTLFSFGVRMVDEAANADLSRGLRADLLTRIFALTSVGFFVWALLSARASFIGVGRGEYFSRRTILGLRNLSLAVLLYNTLAPVIEMIPRFLYASNFKGDRKAEFSMSVAMNEPIALLLIFAAVVALVATAIAHGARIADENRQFV